MSDPVLVTGGTGGLGRAVVERLLSTGRTVVATWLDRDERDALAELHDEGSGLTLVEADVGTREGAETAVAAGGGRLSGLVCVVGGFAMGGRLHEAPEDEFDRMMHLNVTTAQRTCRAAIPAMLEAGGGSIVLIGTRAAVRPFAGAAGYVASKAAVIALAEAISVEYKDDGIRANSILPSVIDTPANRESMPDADHDSWVEPAEIARAIAFLLSDEASATSGAAIPVYGDA